MLIPAQVLPLPGRGTFPWRRYILDTILACAGSTLMTIIMSIFHLYPRIPNISIIYLLVVLALASTRGRYASILACVIAFLSFDFFLISPLYVFTISRIEEWVALFVFLVTALLTSQLAVALRTRADLARRREHETHVLYDLVRLTNNEAQPEQQLSAIARFVVAALANWGVHDCAIAQPTVSGGIQIKANAHRALADVQLSPDAQASAIWVLNNGRSIKLYEDTPPSITSITPQPQAIVHKKASGHMTAPLLRFLPLKVGQKVIAVLLLWIVPTSATVDPFPQEIQVEEERNGITLEKVSPPSFFWSFLNQVATLVERARLEQENVRIAVLQRTDKLRTALLSSVSHDLRTPLTSIKAAASSLLQQDVQWDEAARRGFVAAIEKEADRLNRLVGNLLDMSRIEEGALKPDLEIYSLTALIRDVVNRLAPLLKEREVRLHLPQDLLLVEVDELHIDQVLTNLIENAVRYTPTSSPITINAHRVDQEVMMSVEDQGPGVPEEDLTRIFDKFYRVLHNRHPGNATTGSGLGLAVCKGLVEANNGHIRAELPEAGGLKILVTLPLAPTTLIA